MRAREHAGLQTVPIFVHVFLGEVHGRVIDGLEVVEKVAVDDVDRGRLHLLDVGDGDVVHPEVVCENRKY